MAEAKADLSSSLAAARDVTDPMGVEIFCAGAAPSARRTAAVTDKARYAKLIDRTQWWGRQMVIYGVHVHVGLDSRDKVLPVLDGLVDYFPTSRRSPPRARRAARTPGTPRSAG